jgi:hypothetical protein
MMVSGMQPSYDEITGKPARIASRLTNGSASNSKKVGKTKISLY